MVFWRKRIDRTPRVTESLLPCARGGGVRPARSLELRSVSLGAAAVEKDLMPKSSVFKLRGAVVRLKFLWGCLACPS